MTKRFSVMKNIQYRQVLCDILSIFCSKKPLFFGVFFGVLLVGLAVALLAPPIYKASADLLLKPSLPKSYPPEADAKDAFGPLRIPEKEIEDFAATLKSPELLKQAVIHSRLVSTDSEPAIARFTEHLHSHIKVEVLRASNTVRVSLSGGDPQEVARQLGILVDAYLRYHARTTPNDLAFFEQRSAMLQRQYEKMSEFVGQTMRQK